MDGALLLRAGADDPVANLVAWHTTAAEEAHLLGHTHLLEQFPRPTGLVADLLTYADMTTGPSGQTTTFEGRRTEIADRYPTGSTPVLAMTAAWPRLLALRTRVETAPQR